MTDQPNQLPKKKKVSIKRTAILFVVLFIGYFGLRHFEIQQARKLKATSEVSKYDNIESEIFDLAEEYKSGSHDNFADLPLSEIQEKGAEFIYKMLLRNQQQINELKQETQGLRLEFTKYKSQEKLIKTVFIYVDFRQKLFSGAAYEDSLKSFEMVTATDQNLQEKAAKMRIALKSFAYNDKLSSDFDKLIPEIIATKSSLNETGLVAKIIHNISKLVVIRKIDGQNPHDVDGIISRTEKFLAEEKYNQALETLLTLDQNYHEVLVNFLNELNSAAEVKKIDGEILSYLKNLN